MDIRFNELLPWWYVSFIVPKNGNKQVLQHSLSVLFNLMTHYPGSANQFFGMRRVNASHSPNGFLDFPGKKHWGNTLFRKTPVTWLQVKYRDLPSGRIRQKSPQHQCSVSPRHHIWLTPCRCSMQLFYWPWADFLVRLLEINIRKPAEMFAQPSRKFKPFW